MTCRVQHSVSVTTDLFYYFHNIFFATYFSLSKQHECDDTDVTHVFMKVTTYMARGVHTIGWSVRMALMARSTQCSGFSGGKNGAISFLSRRTKQQSIPATENTGREMYSDS